MTVNRYRILTYPLPSTPEIRRSQIVKLLREAALRRVSEPGADMEISPSVDSDAGFDEGLFDTDDALEGDEPVELYLDEDDLAEFEHAAEMKARRPLESIESRARRRAAEFSRQRKEKLAGQLAHLSAPETTLVTKAIGRGELRGVVSQHEMHERVAALHAGAPWLAAASTEIMSLMTHATHSGPAGLTMKPLILTGPPGIGKSRWARELARLFDVPSIDVDIGATNGATFSLSGVERGWGSASPGRLAQTMLQTHCANPLVILDEIDKIPSSVSTSSGGSLPGAFEVLKSMIEPSTARRWTCPYYRIPFNLAEVNWVMTTNSVSTLPRAFRDRCKVIELRRPNLDELLAIARARIARDFPPYMQSTAETILETILIKRARAHKTTSLRQLDRMLDRMMIVNQPGLLA